MENTTMRTTESLPGLVKGRRNPFKHILLEKGVWRQRQVALFTAVMQDAETLSAFDYQSPVFAPTGYDSKMQEVRKMKRLEKRIEAIKKVKDEFKSFLKTRDSVERENESNLLFLTEMEFVLEREGMLKYAAIVKEKLLVYFESDDSFNGKYNSKKKELRDNSVEF